MGRLKYEKIIVIKSMNRGDPELRDIAYTYLEGIPHIKYKRGQLCYLIIANIECLHTIVMKLWWVCNDLIVNEYLHLRSDGGYCHFYREIDLDTVVVSSKNLKLLWD
jgi:hypothetical protein